MCTEEGRAAAAISSAQRAALPPPAPPGPHPLLWTSRLLTLPADTLTVTSGRPSLVRTRHSRLSAPANAPGACVTAQRRLQGRRRHTQGWRAGHCSSSNACQCYSDTPSQNDNHACMPVCMPSHLPEHRRGAGRRTHCRCRRLQRCPHTTPRAQSRRRRAIRSAQGKAAWAGRQVGPAGSMPMAKCSGVRLPARSCTSAFMPRNTPSDALTQPPATHLQPIQVNGALASTSGALPSVGLRSSSLHAKAQRLGISRRKAGRQAWHGQARQACRKQAGRQAGGQAGAVSRPAAPSPPPNPAPGPAQRLPVAQRRLRCLQLRSRQ